MFDLVRIEQMNAWLDRARTDGRSFDYVHGFLTGLVCTPEPLGTEVMLVSIFDDGVIDTDTGIKPTELLRYLVDLNNDIIEDIQAASFRPHMGRYLRRIRPETGAKEWCLGFERTALAYSEQVKTNEELKFLLLPMLILCGLYDEGDLKLPDEELKDAQELARKQLIPSVIGLYRYWREEE